MLEYSGGAEHEELMRAAVTLRTGRCGWCRCFAAAAAELDDERLDLGGRGGAAPPALPLGCRICIV
jgi:hypothetical protein